MCSTFSEGGEQSFKASGLYFKFRGTINNGIRSFTYARNVRIYGHRKSNEGQSGVHSLLLYRS